MYVPDAGDKEAAHVRKQVTVGLDMDYSGDETNPGFTFYNAGDLTTKQVAEARNKRDEAEAREHYLAAACSR